MASLSQPEAGRSIGYGVRLLDVRARDPLFEEIRRLDAQSRVKQGTSFYTYWEVHRKYTAKELESAELFRMYIRAAFEPAGEECGTRYDETSACQYCGAGAHQVSELFLDLRRLPKTREIARTIAGEIVVSQRLRGILESERISGIEFGPVLHRGHYSDDPIHARSLPSGRRLIERLEKQGVPYGSPEFFAWINHPDHRTFWLEVQNEYEARRRAAEEKSNRTWPSWHQLLVVSNRLSIVPPTRAGVSPFDDDPQGNYGCPHGDNIGHRLLSELFVKRNARDDADVMFSEQFIGSRSGLLRPEPALLVSPRFRRVLRANQLSGVSFEVAHFA